MRIKNERGFTLMELMISFGIFSMIAAGVYGVLYVGNVSWSMQNANVLVQSQARLAVDKLARDLRVASGLSVTQDGDNLEASFTKGGTAVEYAWTTDAGDDQFRLIRTVDSEPIVVAYDVTALAITESAADIRIDVTTGTTSLNRNISYALSENVAKR